MTKNPIIIDPHQGLTFNSEEDLYKYFQKEILSLEKEYHLLRSSTDIADDEQKKYENQLESTLEDPDEIWLDESTFEGQTLSIYIKEFSGGDGELSQEPSLFHVAVTYRVNSIPSFVYLHFPTRQLELVEKYQRGQIIFDRILEEAPPGAIEGDALLEGDALAQGLYEAMLTLRSDDDIDEANFRNYSHFRETAIEDADEIWRINDPFGNVLVNFIKEFSEETPEVVYYVVVTIEDAISNSHALLFSFPTKDNNLVTRYRQGESLHAEDVSQESSH